MNIKEIEREIKKAIDLGERNMLVMADSLEDAVRIKDHFMDQDYMIRSTDDETMFYIQWSY